MYIPVVTVVGISIHAPRAGGDQDYIDALAELGVFQSTPPVRGATPPETNIRGPQGISIHAPRAGGDLYRDLLSEAEQAFQSTPPVRGATPFY